MALFIVVYSLAATKMKALPRLPIKLLLLYFILQFIFVSLPSETNPNLKIVIDVAATMALYWALARVLFKLLVESWYYFKKKTNVPSITRDLFLMAAYAVIALVVLRMRGGVNLVGLITTSAVLTAIIGLAAQNFLGNIFAGISLQIEKPFRIGDWIQYGEYSGRVARIGWEATRLQTFDHETIFIPNLDISKSVIRNYSSPTPRHAMKIDVGVDYEASPNQVRSTLLKVCSHESQVLKEPPPVVRLINFGDSSITYQIRLFYMDYGNYPDLKAVLMNRIWYALKRNGIRIPFPIRDVRLSHIEREFESAKTSKLIDEARKNLDQVPILKPLSEEARNSIAAHMRVEEYGDGETIVNQGDAGDSLFILHSGCCDVEVAVEDHRSKKVATLTPPAFFGEMSLLTGEPRSATVRAHGDAVTFMIDKEIFKSIFTKHPEISEELARALARRNLETKEFVGRELKDQEHQTSKILTRIKTFFGIG